MYSGIRRTGVLALLTAALALGACGGGGGASNPDPGNPPTTPGSPVSLALSTTTVTAQASIVDVSPNSTVTITLPNLRDESVYIGGSLTRNGISTANFEVSGTTTYLRVTFKDPSRTAPGTYTDSIVVRGCTVSPCSTTAPQIAGSPKTISYTYTVSVPANPPRITVQNSVAAQLFLHDPARLLSQNLDVVYTNMGSVSTTYDTITKTSNALNSVNFLPSANPSSTPGHLELWYKSPITLGLGTFTDTVTVKSCLDPDCVNQLAGSPATVTVTSTVTPDLPSAPGNTARPVAIAAVTNNLVWDTTRQVIYVSLGSASAINANTIGILNPASGTFTSHVPVGNNPGDMEISPDGQYLYVALRGANAVQRLSLPSLALDLTIPMGTNGSAAGLYAREMHVSPTAPRTIAVVRSTQPVASGQEYDLAVFDDAVMRTQTASAASKVSTFQWESATRIFGVDSANSLGTAFQIAVGAGGAQITTSQASVTAFDERALLANGRMYMQMGRVFDPLTFAQLGSFSLFGTTGRVLTVDQPAGKAFFLVQDGVRSFNLATLAQIGTLLVPNTLPTSGLSKQIRWGTNGLALLNYRNGSSEIMLVNGPFVAP